MMSGLELVLGHVRQGIVLAASVVALVACGDNIQPQYDIALGLVQGQTPLAVATSVTLEVIGTDFRVTQPVINGQTPRLSLRGLNPKTTKVATFAVTVNGSAGAVAYGQSPPITLSQDQNLVALSIQVQNYGSLARSAIEPRIPRLADSGIVTAFASEATPVATPVLLGGHTLDANGVERPTSASFIYNPFLHTLVAGSYLPPASTGAATWARSDGTIWVVGGRVRRPTGELSGPEVAQDFRGTADHIGVSQYLTDLRLSLIAGYPTTMAAFARANAAITEVAGAAAPLLYVFGGEVVEGDPPARPLSSVVRIDLSPQAAAASMVLQMFPVNMLSPRSRHTATTITVPDAATSTLRSEVLLFGGVVDAPVAEVFDTSTNAFIDLGPEAGPSRTGHKVIRLNGGRVLIVCGADNAGNPLPDARIYDPVSRSFALAPLTIHTPRTGAACFAAGNDLVIAGGLNASKAIEATAEVFDLATFAPITVVPAAPRLDARDAAMPDGTVMLVGGREVQAAGMPFVPTNMLEFYRPRRML